MKINLLINAEKMEFNDKELLEFIEQFNREHSGELSEETPPRNEDIPTFAPVSTSQVCILYTELPKMLCGYKKEIIQTM